MIISLLEHYVCVCMLVRFIRCQPKCKYVQHTLFCVRLVYVSKQATFILNNDMIVAPLLVSALSDYLWQGR